MNKKTGTFLYSAAAVFLTAVILIFPAQCLVFALNGLDLWFRKMIPVLFPFMVLSGVMIRMNLTEAFVKILKPVLFPFFRICGDGIYAIVIGFLCGFPMGAHVIAELYERKRLTRDEASYLLAFCNNIGPVYFLSFVLQTIHSTCRTGLLLFGMYGLPLIYGLLLRNTLYSKKIRSFTRSKKELTEALPLPGALDEAVISSLNGITKLGGYMIFFNLLNIIPFLLTENMLLRSLCGCLLEITGGICSLGDTFPFFVLCALPFGGLSCIAQTYSMIKNTDLSLKEYVIHKLFLTVFSFVYYFFLTKAAF